jgi:1-acyl-sn-glycerol-3-phosphate acyltransferase
VLRSLIFNVLFFVLITTVMLAWLPCFALPRRFLLGAQEFWAKTLVLLMAWIIPLRVEIRGANRLPKTPCIVAAKHQSAWDTFIFHLLLKDPVFVMKKELAYVPLYGWYTLKTGMIPVDRKGGAKAMRKMLKKADNAIRDGRPIVIFPQGTRIAPDTKAPYLPGVGGLYRHLKVPVVPVALNSGLYWPRRRFARWPGTIVLEFLDPIEPGLPRREFMSRLENEIETASARLVAEGRTVDKLPLPDPVDSGDNC